MCVVSTDDTDQESINILQTDRKFRVLRAEALTDVAQREICVVSGRRQLSHSPLRLCVQSRQKMMGPDGSSLDSMIHTINKRWEVIALEQLTLHTLFGSRVCCVV